MKSIEALEWDRELASTISHRPSDRVNHIYITIKSMRTKPLRPWTNRTRIDPVGMALGLHWVARLRASTCELSTFPTQSRQRVCHHGL